MRSSAIALGASVLALALHTAPAAAQTADPGQQVGDSTGAAQVGTVQANAPIRVLSNGDDAAPAGVSAAPQDAGDTTAAGQVGAADVDAPVRVASDGDDSGSSTGTTAGDGDQTAGNSTGSAQVEPANVAAPIRVLSDGDDGVAAAAVDDSPGGDQPAGGGGGTSGGGAPVAGDGPATGTDPVVGEIPAIDPVDDGAPSTGGDAGVLPGGAELLPVAAGDVAGDGASSDELPLTGAALASLVLTGLGLLGGGGALRCASA